MVPTRSSPCRTLVRDGRFDEIIISTLSKKASKWLLQASGPAGLLQFHEPGAAADGFIEYDARHCPVMTIYGGTSEIHRNNIAERHLGLPKARR